MRSCNPARINARTSVVATGKVCQQPVAGKVMGLPGGRGSPIEQRDRDGGQARCPGGPVAYSPGGQHGQPTDNTRASVVARWSTGGSEAMTTGWEDWD
jgi:hypothetical protein